MAKTKQARQPISAQLQRNWGWILGLGILFLFLGFLGLGMQVSLTFASIYFIGALLVIGGVMNLVDAIIHKQWKGMVWQTLISILYIVAGGLVFYDPVLISELITALIALILIIIGTIRIVMACTIKDSKGWGWLLLAGITAIILGVLIILQWPISGFWVIGLFIAIELIVTGWTYIFIAMTLRGGYKKGA